MSYFSSSSVVLHAFSAICMCCACIQHSFVCKHVAPPGECCYNTLLCCDYFSSSSVLSRAFSVLCIYSKFGHHPHPLGYPCVKFGFFAASIAELTQGEKSRTQSLTQSLSHSHSLFDVTGTEAFASK